MHLSREAMVLEHGASRRAQPLTLLILLQPSPVDQSNQVSRLSTIDELSWGQWIARSEKLAGLIAVYAGLPLKSGEPVANYQNIGVIPLTPVEVVTEIPTQAAYSYMIHQFVSVLRLSTRPFKWFFFANDHTFLVPENLMCFLEGRDSELPVYAGNILQRGIFRNVPLKFASGGAGVVLSHTSLKLLVLTWVLTDNPLLKFPLSGSGKADEGCKASDLTGVGGGEVSLMDLGGEGFDCALSRVKSWLLSPKSTESELPLRGGQLTIRVSSKVLLLVSGSIQEPNALVVHYQTSPDHERGHTPVVRVLPMEMLSKCNAVTAWDRINPGLVVAYCLQHVFSASLVPTTAERESAERFNVFGSIRTLIGDVDSWYTECKNNLPPGSLEKKPNQVPPKPLAVAQDVISFHYVSQKESILLYQLLSRRLVVTTPQQLIDLWPTSDKDVGHYSRRIKNQLEATALINFVNRTIVGVCTPFTSLLGRRRLESTQLIHLNTSLQRNHDNPHSRHHENRHRVKLCFYSNSAPRSGAEVALYDYADYSEQFWKVRSFVIFPKAILSRDREKDRVALPKFQSRFTVKYCGPETRVQGNLICSNLLLIAVEIGCNFLYSIKSGSRGSEPAFPGSFAEGVKLPLAFHAVFEWQPHGDAYAAISKFVLGNNNGSIVPHIVTPPDAKLVANATNYRLELNISDRALVLCRHGSVHSFSISYVKATIKSIVTKFKSDRLHIIFLATDPFDGFPSPLFPNVHFLPQTMDPYEKERFFQTCDAMLHARDIGETFGLAVAEMSIRNKPIITQGHSVSNGNYAEAHLHELQDKGLYYHDASSLTEIVAQLVKNGVDKNRNFTAFGQYSPKNVMRQFKSVFLDRTLGSLIVDRNKSEQL